MVNKQNLSWRITNRFNSLEEALECRKEHKTGAHIETAGCLGIIASFSSIVIGGLGVHLFNDPMYVKIAEDFRNGAVLLLYASILTYILLGKYKMNSNPSGHTHYDYYKAAEKYIKERVSF